MNIYIILLTILVTIASLPKYFQSKDSTIRSLGFTIWVIWVILYQIPSIISIILYLKIRLYNDTYMFVKQVRYLLYALMIGVVWGVILYGIWAIFDGILTFTMVFIITGIGYGINMIIVCIGVMINTFWVLKYIVPKNGYDIIDNNDNVNISLNKVLKNQNTVNILMNHLSLEFSMEILLSYLELNMYKITVNKLFNLSLNVNTLYQDLPNSYIIDKHLNKYKLSDIDKIKYICYDMYRKYVKYDAPYMINVNSNTFKKLNTLMYDRNIFLKTNISEMELFQIYDKCIQEMFKLLNYSLSRAIKKPSTNEMFKKFLNLDPTTN